MNTLSVVIPTWSGTPETVEMAIRLAHKIRPMCDELVITEDGGYSKELEEISDIYLLHPRLGHGANLHLGFRASTGDFIALLDSDIMIESGSLRDMVIEDKVVCPIHPAYAAFQGWFVVAPRWVINQCPPYDRTDHHGEGIDFWAEELWNRSRDILVNTDKVTYTHGSSGTYSKYRKEGHHGRVSDGKLKERLETIRVNQDAKMMQDPIMAEHMIRRMPRELDPQRHKQRLTEDTHYYRVWAHVL